MRYFIISIIVAFSLSFFATKVFAVTGEPLVDSIRITVYYTEAAGGSQTQVANVIMFE